MIAPAPPATSREDRIARFIELDTQIAAERKRAPSGIPKPPAKVLKLAKIVRSQVDQFRRQHKDYDQLFEMWLGVFRHDLCRDAEWYAAAELEYRCRVRRCQKEVGTYHEVTANQTVSLARLLHEQGKYSEAATVYRLAIGRWKRVSAADGIRQRILYWLESELENCAGHRPQGLPPEVWAG